MRRYARVRAWTDSGLEYWYWVPEMPRIPEAFLDSVAYLYPTKEFAEAGRRAGGSGFVVGVPEPDEKGHVFQSGPDFRAMGQAGWARHFLYVVTAAHVVFGESDSPVVRLNQVTPWLGYGREDEAPPPTGPTEVLDLPTEAWVRHPSDDVAICPIGPSSLYPNFAFIPESYLLREERLDRIGPGDETFFVGRFITHEGTQKNTPTARFGNISMMPGEPVPSPRTERPRILFLVEMRSLPGYSGSPVFVYTGRLTVQDRFLGGFSRALEQAQRPQRHRGIPVRISDHVNVNYEPLAEGWLLGVDSVHIAEYKAVVGRDKRTPVSDWWVEQNSGMMGVIPAWKILELLDSKELVEMRKKAEEEARKEAEGIVPDSVAPEPYDREKFLADLRTVARRRAEGKNRERPSRSDPETP